MKIPSTCLRFQGRVVVSCQAPDGDPFRDSESMARFARAAVEGGAAGIRANGAEDIRAIRRVADVPIIGIHKETQQDGRILITPSLEAARSLFEAGADIVALDCTARGQRYRALERLRLIRTELGIPVMADIATADEAMAAAEAGADLVATTMRGYTDETSHIPAFEPSFVAELARRLDIPVVAEGRIGDPGQAAEAIRAGAFAVIVGTAITRPGAITSAFARGVEWARRAEAKRYFLGIDLGGTNTKYGVVASGGALVRSGVVATPAGGRQVLLEHLRKVALDCCSLAEQAGVTPVALGIATAGWVDARSGRVAYATENLPGWTGAPIADELAPAVGLPVAVENDANALAVAEKHFGAAKDCADFVCVTLGTGVGGGCYVGGRLNRGAHFFANSLGHITIQVDGIPCNCGRKGCLEVYASAAALLRYADGAFANPEELIEAASLGNPGGRSAIRTYSRYLAVGAASIISLLDPELLILSGGLVQNNPYLLDCLRGDIPGQVIAWDHRRTQIAFSQLGYFGGVFGAAAVAAERAEGSSTSVSARFGAR